MVTDGGEFKAMRPSAPADSASHLSPSTMLLGLALAAGLVLRLAPVLGADFPLLDGGLFSVMATDIRQAHFALPMYSSFNLANVPFAYPPLGLYVLAVIPGDPLVTERWLPVVYSMLAVGAAYLLARELLDETTAGVAVVVFAVMPIAWTVEGGGVTRSLGLALLTATLWRVAVLLRKPTLRGMVVAGVVAAVALLSHPGLGPAGVTSAAMLFLAKPTRSRAIHLAGAGLIALLAVTPWVGFVISRYGLGALTTAASVPHSVGEQLLRTLTVGPSWIAPFDFVAPFAVVASLVLLAKREWLLPAWAALLIVVPEANGRYSAIVWAMLAAAGIMAVVTAIHPLVGRRTLIAVGVSWALVAPFMSGYPHYSALPGPIREAMISAGASTPPGTRFVLASTDPGLLGLALDWFPALSGRISLATSMGLEWSTTETFRDTIELNHRVQRGEFPPDADAVFMFDKTSASWKWLR